MLTFPILSNYTEDFLKNAKNNSKSQYLDFLTVKYIEQSFNDNQNYINRQDIMSDDIMALMAFMTVTLYFTLGWGGW